MGIGSATEQSNSGAQDRARSAQLALTVSRVWGRHSPTRFRGSSHSQNERRSEIWARGRILLFRFPVSPCTHRKQKTPPHTTVYGKESFPFRMMCNDVFISVRHLCLRPFLIFIWLQPTIFQMSKSVERRETANFVWLILIPCFTRCLLYDRGEIRS